MNTHKLPRLTPLARATVVARVQAGPPVAEVARGMGISRQTVSKWLGRAKAAEGAPVPGDPGTALQDRSSRPHPRWTPQIRPLIDTANPATTAEGRRLG
jgi:transposase